MMFETVKERHLERAKALAKKAAEEAACEEACCEKAELDDFWTSSGSQQDPGSCSNLQEKGSSPTVLHSGSDACRLVPRLIDVRPTAEAHHYGVKGSMGVDVMKRQSTTGFVS